MAGKPTEERAKVELVWEAPVERPNYGMYEPVLAEVRRQPGKWARVRVFEQDASAHSAASGLRKKLQQQDEHWETKVGKLEDGSRGLYLRFRTNEQMRESG